MSLSSTSINRPVLAIVMSLVIVVFGVIGFRYLSIREYPSVDPPIITVSASYTGASADVMQGQVTEPLEEALNGIAGIKNLTSTSRDGRTQITVEFDLDADLETAANDVRDKVSGAQGRLPRDIDPAIVSKANADSQPIGDDLPQLGPAHPAGADRLRQQHPQGAPADYSGACRRCGCTGSGSTPCACGWTP